MVSSVINSPSGLALLLLPKSFWKKLAMIESQIYLSESYGIELSLSLPPLNFLWPGRSSTMSFRCDAPFKVLFAFQKQASQFTQSEAKGRTLQRLVFLFSN